MADLQTATSTHSTELAAGAAATALSAANQAGVEIRLLDSVAEFEAASRLVGRIWSDDDPKAPAALLRALSHAGNFVAGAFSEADLVGVSIAFLGQEGDHLHVHSHITGVDPRLQNRSLGFALKQFQRSWALGHGTSSIRWTADPLVRRNLYFNLCKLGASIVDYYADFYGRARRGQRRRRQRPRASPVGPHFPPRGRGRRPAPLEAAMRPARRRLARQRRLSDRAPSRADTLLVSIPDDIVGLRSSDPGQADAWREAVRTAVSERSPMDTGARRSPATAGWS